jgi:uncharacterized protein
MLSQKIQDDLIGSLKAKESDRVEVLRLIRSEIKNAEIDKGAELGDDDIVQLLKKYVKKLREASEMFRSGGRTDLAEQNDAQEKIIAAYLPAEMSDEDLMAAVQAVVSENADLFASNRNAVTGLAMKKLSAQADPQRIMKILQSL